MRCESLFSRALTAPRLACLGYIVPEYYRWPGDLSPSLGLKRPGGNDFLRVCSYFAFSFSLFPRFTDIPTGFAAFSKARVRIAEQSRWLKRPEQRCLCPAGRRW